MGRTEELLMAVIERYQYHKSQLNNPCPVVAEIAKDMVDIDICELWLLTQ